MESPKGQTFSNLNFSKFWYSSPILQNLNNFNSKPYMKDDHFSNIVLPSDNFLINENVLFHTYPLTVNFEPSSLTSSFHNNVSCFRYISPSNNELSVDGTLKGANHSPNFPPHDNIMLGKITQNTYLASLAVEEEIVPDYKCDICAERVPTYSQLHEHKQNHNSALRDTSRSFSDFLLHLMLKSSLKLPNTNSDGSLSKNSESTFNDNKVISSLALLQPNNIEQRKKNYGKDNIACKLCKTRFSSSSSLRKHLSMLHCGDNNRRCCTYCSYKCFQSSDLEKHIARKHTRDFKYKCNHCVKGFTTPKELRNHLARKHPSYMLC